ncbi:MAG: hypothetical protein JSR59_05120 [Proteobacteria bacterium]|nr:hypothetical protein [Pseudomonadota bacterium]
MRTSIEPPRRARRALAALALTAAPFVAQADTVASLLGDFTINQYCGLSIASDAVGVHLAIVYGQLPALRELHEADADRDGVTSQQERDAYVSRLAPELADRLELVVDGRKLPLRAVRWTSSLPKEQTGFSLRIDIDYAAALAAGPAVHALRFDNRNYAGRIGWHEISVQSADGLHVYDTDAHADSLTGGLSEALQSLPASGPLDERAVHMNITTALLPAGARPIARRDGAGPVAAPAATTAGNAGWLPTQTRRLIALISSPQLPPYAALLALGAAILLGALHALSPGHGKAIVGAYLVGSRGTPRHAAFLGAAVTLTHTLAVYALGIATLLASTWIVPERLLPLLGLGSGLLVFGMGIALLVQRWRAAVGAWTHDHHHAHGQDHHHPHAHDAGAPHAHGGRMHAHLPPSGTVSWRGLLALGISGGLLPCPSAMVLLLAAVALDKTLFGLALVLAFSIGMAATLTAVGMAFLYARERLQRRIGAARWMTALPALSAVAITLLGALLCYGSLVGGSA